MARTAAADRDGQRFTGEADALIRPARADLSCIMADLRDYQQVNVDNLEWLLQGLDYNHYFWDANEVGPQYDPRRPGTVWLRSGTLVAGESTAEAAPADPRLIGVRARLGRRR